MVGELHGQCQALPFQSLKGDSADSVGRHYLFKASVVAQVNCAINASHYLPKAQEEGEADNA